MVARFMTGSTVHRQATGNAYHLTGHEVSVVAGEECHHARNIFGFTETAHRYRSFESLVDALAPFTLVQEGPQHRRIGWPWAHTVEDHALPHHLARHRFGESDQASLPRGIDCLSRRTDAAGIRSNGHHSAASTGRHALQMLIGPSRLTAMTRRRKSASVSRNI